MTATATPTTKPTSSPPPVHPRRGAVNCSSRTRGLSPPLTLLPMAAHYRLTEPRPFKTCPRRPRHYPSKRAPVLGQASASSKWTQRRRASGVCHVLPEQPGPMCATPARTA